MELTYSIFKYHITFEESVLFTIQPTFLFRSLIGKELKYLSCVLKHNKCADCGLRTKCAYSFIFENPIESDNEYLKGRKNTSPPYIFHINKNLGDRVDSLDLHLVLIGNASDYEPYLTLALQRAGESGVLQYRTKYMSYIKESSNRLVYTISEDENMENVKLCINFLAPFRYRKEGRYSATINFEDVILACVRRLNILSGFYGDRSQIDYPNSGINIMNTKSNLTWRDDSHYSARQKRQMLLGGVVGSMQIEGELSNKIYSILKSAEIFNIGKSISFGLGVCKITEVL